MLGHIFGSAQLSIHSLPWWPLVANNLGKRVSILQSVTLRRLHVPLVQKIFGRWLCFYIGHSVCILPYIVSHPSKAVGSLIIYLISCLVNPRGKTWLRMGDCLRVWKERLLGWPWCLWAVVWCILGLDVVVLPHVWISQE